MQDLSQYFASALESAKARDIEVLNVRGITDITDYMIIASGTSTRHVASLAINLASEAKKEGFTLLGHEGTQTGEWALLDFGDVVVHVMHPETREFYQLEKLWRPESISSMPNQGL